MAIVFDIGKTNMRVAYSTDGMHFDTPLVAPTPSLFDDALKVFIEMAKNASMGRPIDILSGGLPGTLNQEKTGLLLAPSPITDWALKPFSELVHKELGGEVILSNDAVLVALGEALFGAGKGHAIVGYLTFSTGIGGARVVDGEVDRTAFGFEPGKLVLPHLGEGMTAEDLASGSGLRKRFNKAPYEIRDEDVWLVAAKAAGYEVQTATLFWSPHVIVLGGPMITGDPAIPFDQIQREASLLLGERREELVLVKASLAGFGGLWGALTLLRKARE